MLYIVSDQQVKGIHGTARDRLHRGRTGYEIITHEPGEMSVVSNTTKGLTFYGGAAEEGNVNSFHACPVSYMGTTVGSMQLGSIHTNTARPPVATDPQPGADEGLLSFRRSRSGSHAPTDDEAPFTWPIRLDSWTGNTSVENVPGETEFWIENRGLIKNGDGLDVSAEFRTDGATHKEGPFQFDFAAPRVNQNDSSSEIVVSLYSGGSRVRRSVAAGEFFSNGSPFNTSTRLEVSNTAEKGVGGVADAIAVGDCSVSANTDNRGSTEFVALFDDIRNISELPESDAEKGEPAEDGVDCYVAELQSLTDAIGNSRNLGNISRIQTKAHFGVDHGAPTFEVVEPEQGAVLGFSSTAPTAVYLYVRDVEDPELETGEDGSGVFGATPQRLISGRWRTQSGITATNADKDLFRFDVTDLDDGSHSMRALVWDSASPGNVKIAAYSFTKDTKAPTFSSGGSPGGALNAGSSPSITVAVSGTIKDANPIEEALLTVMTQGEGAGSSNDICGGDDMTDMSLPRSRARKYDLENGSKTIEFDQAVTIARPPGGGMEELCFNLELTDSAVDEEGDDNGNVSMYSAGNFSVNWGLGVTVSEDELEVAEGGDATYTMVLQSAPVGDVTVTLGFSNTHVTTDDSTFVFTTTTWEDEQTVTVSAAQDDDAVNEATTISHTASGGGYGNVSVASVAVDLMDNDATLAVDVDEIDEGVIDTVTVTVEFATAVTAETPVELTFTDDVPDDDEAPAIAEIDWDGDRTVLAGTGTITIAAGAKKGMIVLEIEVGEFAGTRDRKITVTTNLTGNVVADPDDVDIKLVNDDS